MAHFGSIRETGPDLKQPDANRWISSGLLRGVAGLIHGFSLRAAGDFAEPEAARQLLCVTGAAKLRLLQQVHGTLLAAPDDPRDLPEADGWVGRPPPGVLLGVRTADCLPVLYCHPTTRTLGLAHAGWRGAAAGIARGTLKRMEVPAEEVFVVLGPCIGPCCYEVGEDVASAIGVSSPHLRAAAAGKYRFDLPGFVRSQLFEAGVSPRNLDLVDLCTAHGTDRFYSYRAESQTGRLCSFLGWSEA